MKKLYSLLITAVLVVTFSVNAFANGGTSLLQQKMNAKGKTAGLAKVIAQYQIKFKQLMGQIEYQYTVLDGVVNQSQNLTDDDKTTLLDLLENDEDYSWSNVQSVYKNMMDNLPKNDVKASTKLFETTYQKFSDVLSNLNAYQRDLPQYYIYDNSQVTDNSSDNSDDSQVTDDNSGNDDNSQITDDNSGSNDNSQVKNDANGSGDNSQVTDDSSDDNDNSTSNINNIIDEVNSITTDSSIVVK